MQRRDGRIWRIGVLLNRGNPSAETETLRAGMLQLGYFEGINIAYEIRAAEGQLDRLPAFAEELMRTGVDVFATYGGPPTNAARRATSTIPIVFALVADPVGIGVAASLQRPGANLTGVTNNDPEVPVRQMVLLKEIVPHLSRVAIIGDLDTPGADASGLTPGDRAITAAAHAAGLTPQVLKLRGPRPDLDAAFETMAHAGAEALLVPEVPAVFSIAKAVAEMATARGLPTMFWGGQGEAGGLMSYGTSYTETYPRVPTYVDRMLKGARPDHTAIEVYKKHQLVIDLRTARALGLMVPEELLKRADRLIE